MRRRGSEKIDSAVLPEGYTRVNWLQGGLNSGVCINTGAKSGHNVGIMAVIDADQETTAASLYNGTYFFGLPYHRSATTVAYAFGSTVRTVNLTHSTGKITICTNFLNAKHAEYDGVVLPFVDSIFTGYNIYIFAKIAANPSLCNSSRIYSCKISEDENIVRDFVPCLDPQGVACMFDTITQAPFYTASGAFTYG